MARGNAAVAERRTWLEPFWDDVFVALHRARAARRTGAVARRHASSRWREAEAAISADAWPVAQPVGAPGDGVALAARADRACAAAGGRATSTARPRRWPPATRCSAWPARAPATRPGPRRCSALRAAAGWPAAEAEYDRATRPNAPAAWEAVLDEFGPGLRVRDRADPVAARRGAGGGRAPRRGRRRLAVGGARPPPGCAPRRSPRRLTTWPAAPASTSGSAARSTRQRRREPGRRPDRPRTRGAAPAGPRPVQPRDRHGAVHHPEDRQRARLQHPRQARRREPHGSRRHRLPRRPLTARTRAFAPSPRANYPPGVARPPQAPHLFDPTRPSTVSLPAA